MNNKVSIEILAQPTYTQAGNLAFAASGIDELLLYSNDLWPTNNFISADAFYIPENLSTLAAVANVTETATRQDIKRRLAPRLGRATYGQGLVIWSQDDSFAQYFIESVLLATGGNGYIRVGVCNFTADFANNPLATDNQSTLNAVYSFFDISAS